MFKVGDWVRHTKSGYIKENPLDKYNLRAYNCDDGFEPLGKYYELWQPKEGEWCWFNKQYFVKVHKVDESGCIYFYSLDGMYIDDWEYLNKFEPFIGELPTFLQY